MGLEERKAFVMASLRGGQPRGLLSEADAWPAIVAAVKEAGNPGIRKREHKRWADALIYDLGLIYARQTGSLPGFTNSENETRFERFACAVMADCGIRLTRNLVKAAIRRLAPKQNPAFTRILAAAPKGLSNDSVGGNQAVRAARRVSITCQAASTGTATTMSRARRISETASPISGGRPNTGASAA